MQSRYYNPAIGRFLNADSYASTGQGIIGNNMFAYCNNNPVVFTDHSGYRAVFQIDSATRTPSPTIISKLKTDIRNWDLLNTDAKIVYDSNYFSAYKGTFVIRHSSDYLTSWAIGDVIFLNHNNDSLSNRDQTLNHEYGHILQEREFGKIEYLITVFLPSTIYNYLSRGSIVLNNNYYNMPWEYDADVRGSVNRDHADWAMWLSFAYFS